MSEIIIELHSGMAPEEWDRAMAKLEELGFAESLRPAPLAEKKGKWEDYCGDLICDQCGNVVDIFGNKGKWNYCPNCGARMEENDETDRC